MRWFWPFALLTLASHADASPPLLPKELAAVAVCGGILQQAQRKAHMTPVLDIDLGWNIQMIENHPDDDIFFMLFFEAAREPLHGWREEEHGVCCGFGCRARCDHAHRPWLWNSRINAHAGAQIRYYKKTRTPVFKWLRPALDRCFELAATRK